MEDDTIIALYWSRDETAIAATKSVYGARLRRFAYQILKNNEDAEESESDTYLHTWNSIPPTRPRFFFAYLTRICRNAAFSILDRQNAKKRHAVIVELTAEMESCIPDRYQETKLEGEEIGRLLNLFLSGLAYEKRLIFMRRYFFADSVGEIAKHCKISESKVKTTLFRTRKRLKDFLEREGIAI